jgi:hypothetical protein
MSQRAKLLAALAVALIGMLGALAPAATADVPVQAFGLLPSTTQAGGHPDVQISLSLKNGWVQQAEEGLNTPCDCEAAQFVTVHAPPGLVGSPANLPRCTAAQLGIESCPVDSQVGIIEVGFNLSADATGAVPVDAGLYNMVPRAGEAGLLAFSGLGIQVLESFSSRTGSDYGLDTQISVPNLIPLRYSDQIIWGVPADPSHDSQRYTSDNVIRSSIGTLCDENGVPATPNGNAPIAPGTGPDSAIALCGIAGGETGAHSNSPLTPFIESPTICGTPLQSGLDVRAYDGTTATATAPYPATVGCDQLSFNPSLAAKPTTTAADSPSGLDVDLSIPQFESPTVPSPSEIKATEVTLPEGFTINPNAADGKSACTDEEAAFGTLDEAHCPQESKIGSLEIHTAILPGPLPGYLYLGRPLPGNRYRVFLAADAFGVHIKLPGTIRPDSVTGRLTLAFQDLPQTPFEDFTLHVFGSERGSLATPTRCGTYQVSSTFTPWDAVLPEQTSTQSFTIDSGPGGTPCPNGPRPFAPSFAAGSAGNTAGAHSSFALDVSRADGDQFLSGLTIKTPIGFSASLKGVPYCPEAAIAQLGSSLYSGLIELASPTCPSASQIGTVTAGAGAGSKPFYAPGKVYLAGPYKGAPLSLGNVVARAAIEVDPVTARVTTTSDPLPQIIEGIPLRTRSLRVNIDRPHFALNPTNCDPLLVDALLSGDEGATSSGSVHYQVSNCASLAYRPQLSLRLAGGLARLGHPAIHAVFTAKLGEANTRRVSVTLPKGELLDNSHINSVCTRVDFARHACPGGSRLGQASVTTPLLDEPLKGNIYLRSSQHELPDLVLDLQGQLDIEAAARIDSVNGRLRTTFEAVPDVPVSRIELDLTGGSKGLLQNSQSLCPKPKKAMAKMTGQNGATLTSRIRLEVACGSTERHKRHHHRVHARGAVR